MSKLYSDWLKIDLHIHTDFSRKTKKNDYKGVFSVDVLQNKLKEQDVSIFSLTDHNIINLDAYKEYYEKFNSDTDPLLLVGVELDILGSSTTYHSLLIFNCNDYDGVKAIHDNLESKYAEKGCDRLERKLTFDDIIFVFDDLDFFFIPHAGNTSSIINGYKDDIAAAQKMLILLQSPMEKVQEKRRQIYNEHFDVRLSEAFRHKEDFAYLEFSDNHNIEKYPCRHMGDQGDHEFYYVKGSKNYETLRISFIDPKSRIKNTQELLEIKISRDYLRALKIKGNNLLIDNNLNFSPHLNVIIGGRSSGKSLMMDILKRSIDVLESEDKYNAAVEGSTITVISSLDAMPKLVTHLNTDILQINQGAIANYFEKNELSSLARKSGKFEEYQIAKAKFNEIQSELDKRISDLHKIYEDIYEKKADQAIILHNHTIDKLLNSEYHLKMNKDRLIELTFASEKFDETIKVVEDIEALISKVKKASTIDIEETEDAIIEGFVSLLLTLKHRQKDKKLLHEYMTKFIEDAHNIVTSANDKLNIAGKEKALAEKSKQEIIKKCKVHFNAFVQLNICVKSILSLKLNHTETIDLDEDSKLCIELQPEKEIKESILDGIKDYSKDDLYHSLVGLLYNETSLKNYGDNTADNFGKKLKSQIKALASCFDKLTDYLEYQDGTTSKSNSPGYNSEMYLKVVLNNPKCGLVIIDQPEDNLGNKFISDQLVELIRKIKFKKQIILITHNPAIVVYGDAESIIIAENLDNRISYKQVKLEDIESQKRICETLDGGEYIFDNRSRKYNIQRLLQEAGNGKN
ncbi:MAG: hypothetical protein AB7V16_00915 [Vulcanibacillus sp.]